MLKLLLKKREVNTRTNVFISFNMRLILKRPAQLLGRLID